MNPPERLGAGFHSSAYWLPREDVFEALAAFVLIVGFRWGLHFRARAGRCVWLAGFPVLRFFDFSLMPWPASRPSSFVLA